MSDNHTLGRAVGVDHVGYVVTDLAAAVQFLTDVLGFYELNRTGLLRDDEGDSQSSRYNVHPRAVGRYIFLGIGEDKVELLEWSAPERDGNPVRNTDAGGRHLALKIDDMDEAIRRLSVIDGVTVREPNERGFRYVTTPFGLEIQLIP